MSTLSPEAVRRVYDRIGRLQDLQAFYEDPATDIVLRHGDFGAARSVFELGCGTGRLAFRLLVEHLGAEATYEGVDVSPTMVDIAGGRLEPFGDRARVRLSDGGPPAGQPDGAHDRFVATYVLDLLPEEDIAELFTRAHGMLEEGGLICLASLSSGTGALSRSVARLWSAVHRLSPALVGGCRPVELLEHLPPADWRVRRHERVAPFAIPSEVVVAERIDREAP